MYWERTDVMKEWTVLGLNLMNSNSVPRIVLKSRKKRNAKGIAKFVGGGQLRGAKQSSSTTKIMKETKCDRFEYDCRWTTKGCEFF